MGARRLAGLTAAALLAHVPVALAAPATPDPGFGSDGTVVAEFTGRDAQAAGMLLDRSGRAVVVARTGETEIGLMRRLPNGAADVATTDLLAGPGELTEVIEQAAGGYVAGGWVEVAGSRRVALERFDA